MGSSTSSKQLSLVGVLTEITGYTEAKALIVTEASRVLRYGALVHVLDRSSEREYLGLVVDVKEHSIAPAIDTQRLRDIARQVQARGLGDALQLLRELYSPTQGLIRLYGVRELELRILGEIKSTTGLVLPEQPPRPGSLVVEPDAHMLEALITHGLAGKALYLGRLAYNPGVRVYLDPEGLTTHLAVVGQTGSGKTETVKRIVAEYSWKKGLFSRSGGVIVFDVTGEYTGYPYYSSSAVPLLEAILEPSSHGGGWASSARKTIFVPYDASRVARERERSYATRDIGGFVEALNEKYGGLGYQVKAIVFGREGVYLVEGRRTPTPITRRSIVEFLRNEPFLVVVAPLPDTLTVDEIVELSGSKSEYFPLLLPEIAEYLSLLGVDEVYSTTVLAEIVEITWRAKRRAKDQAQLLPKQVSNHVTSIIGSIKNARIKLDEQGRCRVLGSRNAWRPEGVRLTCPAWLTYFALKTVLEEPETSIDLNTVREQLQAKDMDTGVEWEKLVLTGVENAVRVLAELPWHSMASIVRGLLRVKRMVSPYLDVALSRILVERIIEGFTIIHLAPPSIGQVDMHVARLLEQVFSLSMAKYEAGRAILIVVEEAHNLAPAGEEKASKKALLRIAREGRKWGLSLVLVSQRPGFVDSSILSQAASIVAMRITNPEDIDGLRRSVESVSQELVDHLPDLDRGQAVVSGMVIAERKIPVLVMVDKLEPSQERRTSRGNRAPAQPGDYTRTGSGGGLAGSRRSSLRDYLAWERRGRGGE